MATRRALILAFVLLAGCTSADVAKPPAAGTSAALPPAPPETSAPPASPATGTQQPASAPTAPPAGPAAAAQAPPSPWSKVLVEGRARIPVPVPVYLLGFPEATATALQAILSPLPIDANLTSSVYAETLDGVGGIGFPREDTPNPILPVAAFQVERLPDDLLSAYRSSLPLGAKGQMDGNHAEAFLAKALADRGRPLGGNASALVVVHLGETGHHYEYDYGHGSLTDLRIFGGTHPLVVFDASAGADPAANETAHSYKDPVGPTGPATVAALAEAARDAARFRLLQGAIYPPSLAPCHAVTLLYLVRTASMAGAASHPAAVPGAVDLVALERAYEDILRREVHLDLKVLHLPAEEPALDALYRGISIGPGDPQGIVAGVFLNQARTWVEDRFDDHWVPHAGCAPYLGVLLHGDAGDLMPWGIAMFDPAASHRVHFATTGEAYRALGLDWEHHLFLHEMGHLLSLPHPEDGRLGNRHLAFAGVVSAMSYHVQERTRDAGAIDPINHARNRAGQAFAAAHGAGRLDTAAGQAALTALLEQRWDDATHLLLAAADATATP